MENKRQHNGLFVIWGIIVAILVMIPVPYAQGASACASLPAAGTTDAGDQGAETPFTSSECGSSAHVGSGFTMSCTACGATLLPRAVTPPTATLEVRWSSVESMPSNLNTPFLPWRPPA
jgi:hypothetical protein